MNPCSQQGFIFFLYASNTSATLPLMAHPQLKSPECWDDPFGIEGDVRLKDFDMEFSPVSQENIDNTKRLQADPFRHTSLSIIGKEIEHPLSIQPWPPNLIFDLALGLESTVDVLKHHEVSLETYEHYLTIPAFRKELADTMRMNRESGISFGRRAAAMAEDCLPDMYNIVKDKQTPANTRVAIFRDLTRLGSLEPKQEKTENSNGAPQVNIQINL